MDVQKYLNRIGSLVPAEPDLDALRSLHTRHLLSVPFEDLTVHSGGRVELDLPLIYDKIVTQRRGGLCYENNGLFSWLLSSLGFQVTMLSAQVKGLITGCDGNLEIQEAGNNKVIYVYLIRGFLQKGSTQGVPRNSE